jgi:predicted GNAT family acetyltransferase
MIKDNAEKHQVEIWVDDELAGFVEYHDRDLARAFVHTEIEPAFEGRGLASELTRHVLDEARASGRQVLPYCPFVRGYIERHRDYVDLVPEDKRAEFGLA